MVNLDVVKDEGYDENRKQMGKNKPITFKNPVRIGKALDYTPNDVISFDDDYGKEEGERN